MGAVWTQQRIAPCTLTVAFPGGLDPEDLDRSLDQALPLRSRLTHQALALCTRLGCRHPIVPDAFAPFGKPLWHPPSKKGGPIHPFPRSACALVRALVGRHGAPILAVDTPQGERRTDDVLRHIPRAALRARGHITLGHVGHNPMGILAVTRIDARMPLVCLQGLATPLQGLPWPLLVQHPGGHGASMHPLLSLLSTPAAGGNAVQRRMVLAMATMRLSHDDGTALELLASHRAEEIVQAPDATPKVSKSAFCR
jgi:hypothetical protein